MVSEINGNFIFHGVLASQTCNPSEPSHSGWVQRCHLGMGPPTIQDKASGRCGVTGHGVSILQSLLKTENQKNNSTLKHKKCPCHHCWWFRNPAHQLRLVVYPTICRVLQIPGGFLGSLSINSINISALGRVISVFSVAFPSASWPIRHPCISATAHRKAAAPRLISAMLIAYMLVVPTRNLASPCIDLDICCPLNLSIFCPSAVLDPMFSRYCL